MDGVAQRVRNVTTQSHCSGRVYCVDKHYVSFSPDFTEGEAVIEVPEGVPADFYLDTFTDHLLAMGYKTVLRVDTPELDRGYLFYFTKQSSSVRGKNES